jgi:predicted nucleic acid-binding protein
VSADLSNGPSSVEKIRILMKKPGLSKIRFLAPYILAWLCALAAVFAKKQNIATNCHKQQHYISGYYDESVIACRQKEKAALMLINLFQKTKVR